VIKLKRMRWVKHVTFLEEIRNTYKILVRKSEWKSSLGGLYIEGMIILKLILQK